MQIKTEKLLTFREIAKDLPKRGGRKIHISTLHRWRHPGLRGIRLEALRVGGIWCTSWPAFHRFCQRLTARAEGTDSKSVSAKRSANKSTETQLQNLGW